MGLYPFGREPEGSALVSPWPTDSYTMIIWTCRTPPFDVVPTEETERKREEAHKPTRATASTAEPQSPVARRVGIVATHCEYNANIVSSLNQWP